MSKFAGGALAGFFLLFPSGIVLLFNVFLGLMMVRQTLAISYPTVPGTITRSDIEVASDSDGTTYQPRIEYTYSVDGVHYAGDTYRYGTIGSSGNYASNTVARFPVGSTVDVHYSPNNPSDAVLVTGLEGFDLLFSLFLTPFNLVVFGLWYGAWQWWRRDPERPFSHFRVVRTDDRSRVELNDPRLLIAGIVASGVSIVLVVALGMTGFGVALPVGIGAWIITAFASVWGYRVGRPRGGVPWAIALDDLAGTVEIFRSSRTESDVTISASAIKAVQLGTEEQTDSDGTTTTYSPAITHVDEVGKVQREVLGHWNVEAKANDFVGSLCAWLKAHGVVRDVERVSDPGSSARLDGA